MKPSTIMLLVLSAGALAACSSSWGQKWCWFGGCKDNAPSEVVLPPVLPSRAVAVMNAAVAFCGFQPSEDTTEALLLATPERTEESIASAICSATKPRWLMNRGFVLPMVDGVPIRGRYVR